MKQVVLFLILVFGITWSVGFWVAAQPAPTTLGGFLAAFLPQVWAPTSCRFITRRGVTRRTRCSN